ncbi:hypothetical protein C7999DRAFT_14153 [Corynascus novoguineensis]|uniref:Uncharacterized protein n=1 Tax=Corynascus novoguineensis TaxID=1126955 RepID=A0AAN7HQU3_9PEZI|nr:hypothetical protein C7999DRAFT_14153 [Corynascus novoguineensis]
MSAPPPPPPSPPPPPPPPPPFSRPRKRDTQPSSSSSSSSSTLPPTDPSNPQSAPPLASTTLPAQVSTAGTASGGRPRRGAVLVSLLVYNGYPFADHWEYFAASPADADAGVVVQAAGDVLGGFWLEVRRGWRVPSSSPSPANFSGVGVPKRVPLAWVGEEFFLADSDDSEGSGVVFKGGDNHGEEKVVVVEREPRCEFERALFRVPAPEKTLRTVTGKDGEVSSYLYGRWGKLTNGGDRRGKIKQRNCQTWVVESAEQLVKEGIFEQRVADYLRATSIMTF